MGLQFSPYQAIRMTQIAEEILIGDPQSEDNPFQFSQVKLKLPGTPDYIPGTSWFSVRTKNGFLSSSLSIYVDDKRVHAQSKELAWKCGHQVATREAYLGLQDAGRKRQAPSQNAGAWAGSIIRTNSIEVGVLVSDERWSKTRTIFRKWLSIHKKDPSAPLPTKELHSDRGFLIYIARMYQVLTTFIKGIHLTLNGWHPDRDIEGWRDATLHATTKQDSEYLEHLHEYPDLVQPVPRLMGDLTALAELTES